jgi:hypothetical protein
MNHVNSRVSPITVSIAFKKAQAALLQSSLLSQRAGILDENLQSVVREDPYSPLGAAAKAFIEARAQLNRVLRDQLRTAAAESTHLSNEYLTKIFGTAIPGPVTLPLDAGEPVTYQVKGLSSFSGGAKAGFVEIVTPHGGTDTVRFYELDGKYVFAEPDLY